MSVEQNKEIARRLVQGFSVDGDIDETFALLHEDAVWTVMAHPASFGASGDMSKAQFVEHMKGFRAVTPNGLRMTVTGVTAEGDRVAVEAESSGTLGNGKTFGQVYHFLFEIRDGKVMVAREYLDTARGAAVFGS
ncbi:nuclear transport factor 2 family protein [Streptomyces marincola]|uniref:nuclear transport factor 2 family protein n=1 Tax=Streptomyces marincola TaxID=2878388 RepID=UPI001CF39532|nr:nuclear transport factor 2 family protein [Streptomyces marincola]UCM90430.1 nuclear transport factor 2 family protein [Streptomyces marincola]